MNAKDEHNFLIANESENVGEQSFLQGLKPKEIGVSTWGPFETQDKLKPPPPKEGAPTATKVVLTALRFYKAYLSVLVGGSCRFVPTCSMYAYEAVERFGVAHGAWLTLKRLQQCHPLSRKFGYDPVPEVTARSAAATPEEAHL